MPLTLFRRKKNGKPAGFWIIRGTVAGQAIYESTGCSVKAQAEAIRVRRETELAERRAYGKAATLTFAEAALTYLETGGEARFLPPIIEHFGPDTLLQDVDNAAINRAASILYPKAAAATINRQLITPIAAVLNLAADEGLTPPRKLRRRKGDKQRTRWLTPEEADKLFAELPSYLMPAVAFLLGTGARTSEAFSVQQHEFYPITGEAWIANPKNGDPRMVRMPQRALDMILARPMKSEGALLRTSRGLPYKIHVNRGGQIAEPFNAARDAAGLGPDVTPHVLRHTWATWFHAATRDFGTLLDLGGWKDAGMANRYRKAAPLDLADRLMAHGWDFSGTAAGDVKAGLRAIS